MVEIATKKLRVTLRQTLCNSASKSRVIKPLDYSTQLLTNQGCLCLNSSVMASFFISQSYAEETLSFAEG